MKFVKLKEVCNFIGGSQPPAKYFSNAKKPGYVRLLQIRDFESDNKAVYIPKDMARRICLEDDVMIARYGGYNNYKTLFKILRGKSGSYNVALIKTVPDENKISKGFLYFVLRQPHLKEEIIRKSSRAVQSGFTKDDLNNLEIPLPPLSEQKRIVETIEKADLLRKKRQEADELSKIVIQSLFIEMFGDLVINKKGWVKKKLSESDIEIIDGDRGKNYPKQQDFLDNGWCLFLNTKNVTKEGFKLDTTMFISREKDQQLRKGKLQRNDMVLTTRGTVGNVALYDNSIPFDNVRINSGMVILRANLKKFNLVFLVALLNSKYFHKQKDRIVSGCAQPQLPIRHLKDIEIFIPPIDQQQKFADLVQKV
jgi:type I restriction enzyme S subunit